MKTLSIIFILLLSFTVGSALSTYKIYSVSAAEAQQSEGPQSQLENESESEEIHIYSSHELKVYLTELNLVFLYHDSNSLWPNTIEKPPRLS